MDLSRLLDPHCLLRACSIAMKRYHRLCGRISRVSSANRFLLCLEDLMVATAAADAQADVHL
jgi:hypothetical protein